MALLRVFAHHQAVPASFGAPSPVLTGAPPPLIAVYWAELAEQSVIDAEGFGPPAVLGPVTAGGGVIGNFTKPTDRGFTVGSDFAVTNVYVIGVNGGTKIFDYTLITPSGQVIVVPTTGAAVAVGGGSGFSVPVSVPLAKGVWKIEVRLKPGTVGAPGELFWGAGAPTVPYVGLEGSPAESLLAVVFDGTPVITCHTLTATSTSVPCSPNGNTPVQATFTATLVPSIPAYAGAIDWEVTDAVTGNVVFSVPGGGTVETLTFPGTGSYTVVAAIVRPSCSPVAYTWSTPVTVASCTGGGGGGGGGCLASLIPAMIAVAVAGVSLALWGASGGTNGGLLSTAFAATAIALAAFTLWMILCRNCPAIVFLSQYFRAMMVLMLGIAALLTLVGQPGGGKGASAIAALFATVAATLALGRKALRCP
jgi:hypothetical protein